jgi:hypothetical protein
VREARRRGLVRRRRRLLAHRDRLSDGVGLATPIGHPELHVIVADRRVRVTRVPVAGRGAVAEVPFGSASSVLIMSGDRLSDCGPSGESTTSTFVPASMPQSRRQAAPRGRKYWSPSESSGPRTL